MTETRSEQVLLEKWCVSGLALLGVATDLQFVNTAVSAKCNNAKQIKGGMPVCHFFQLVVVSVYVTICTIKSKSPHYHYPPPGLQGL